MKSKLFKFNFNFTYTSSLRSKMSSLDDDALSKMNKIGIIFYFKSQIELYNKLLESKDQLLESKDFSTAQMVESSTLKLSIANGKYLKLKGNLNIRGLVEEFEQSDLFKECRKSLSTKWTVTDEASGNTFVELRAPSRKALWDEAMKDKEFSGLLACIAKSNPERRDTVGERIRDLYSSLSRRNFSARSISFCFSRSNAIFCLSIRSLFSRKMAILRSLRTSASSISRWRSRSFFFCISSSS
jgi:hypothetical protein